MKICMLAYTFYERDGRVRRYAETLVKRGDEVDAIAIGQEGQAAHEVIKGVHVFRIQKRIINEKWPLSYLLRLLKFFFRSAWFLTRRHLATPYQVIHVHSVPDFEVFATLIPRLMGAKVILDIHDIVPEFYAGKFKKSETSMMFKILLAIEKLSVAYSNHVIISNHLWQKKLSTRSVRPEKCTAIINYPDPAIFYPRRRTTDNNGNFVMCYPGTLNWHQGLDVAVRAMALLRDKAPNLRFQIVGDGPDREKLKAMIAELNLEDRVFLDLLSLEKVAELMSNVDLGVVPKRKNSFGNEAFSTKIPEFMAMGVPVIASRTRIDEFYFNDNIILFFESENVEDLTEKILELVRDEEKRKSLCEQATVFIRDNNWDVKKNEYLGLVDCLTMRSDAAKVCKKPPASN